MKYLFKTLLLIVISNSSVEAQSLSEKTSFMFSLDNYINLTGTDSALPFWFHSEQYGIVDQSSANSIFSSNISTNFYSSDFFQLNGESDFVIRASKNSSVFFNLLNLNATIGGFKLQGGKFIDPMSELEDELSTGSLMLSRNASPFTKIGFSTNDFIAVPFTRGYITYNGYIAHGWLNDERFTDNLYVHQKYLYLNLDLGFLHGWGGIVHNAQWGGESERFGMLPSDLNAFIDVFFAQASTDIDAPNSEQTNVAGNSIATYDFKAGVRTKPVNFNLRRVFYLEDGVSRRFRSPWDGIWQGTLIINNSKFLQKVYYEHLNFKKHDSFPFEPYGSQNYYSHGIYRTGWTYSQRVLGNALILTDGTIDRPIYNNIVLAHHVGVTGTVNEIINYIFKYTYSRNYGIFQDQIIERIEGGPRIIAVLRPLEELKKVNHSIYLELETPFTMNEDFQFNFSVSTDIGELYSSNLGIGVGLTYKL